MSLIQVARYSDVKYDFKDGYACVPVLEEAFDQARFAHCALQPGHSITPDVYSVTEHNQLFIFTKGKGYVTTPREAWNVTEPRRVRPRVRHRTLHHHLLRRQQAAPGIPAHHYRAQRV